MKKEGLFVILFLVLLCVPFVSANIEESFSEIQDYIFKYDAGELTAPQLMVYISYARNKMYEDMDEQQLSESEVKKVFDKVDRSKNNYWDAEYEKVFFGEDFNVVFKARSFIKHDRESYESREDTQKYYYIDYELVPVVSSDFSFEKKLDSFIEEIKETVDDEDLDYEGLQEEFSAIRTLFQKSVDCVEFAEDYGFEYEEKDYPSSEKRYYKILETEMKEDCWTEMDCEGDCKTVKECEDTGENCWTEWVCEDVEGEEICEPCEEDCEYDENGTEVSCEPCEDYCYYVEGGEDCYEKEKCEGSEENCWEYEDCSDDCEEEEICNEWVDSELSVNINCNEDWSDIHLGGWNKFERYNAINEGMDWNCEDQIQSLVTLRKVIQKDFDEDFVRWYFDEFIGKDYFKIIHGGDVLHDIVWKLIRIEEDLSYSLHCSETGEWPDGFEKIDINYNDGNTHFEVWEKYIPMEGMNVDYYTTMYKYYWSPDKEMAKELLVYMVDNELGPTARDIAKIKADEGQMALIETLAEKYGGSFDINLKLKQKDSDFEISRNIMINTEDAIKITEEEVDADISVEIDFDILYNFIISMTKMKEGERIQGPYWVQIHEEEGPGDLFSVLGLVSKAWREGVTISPKYSLIKLFFTAKDVTAFMSGEGTPSEEYMSTSKISGEVVLDR